MDQTIQPQTILSDPNHPHRSMGHWLIVILVIISVVGYFMISYAYSLWPFESLGTQIAEVTPQPVQSVTSNQLDTSTWKTYTNTEYGFSFKYPGDADILSVGQDKTVDGTTINKWSAVPRGIDQTQVNFFFTSAPIEQAKYIRIYNTTIKNSEFASTTMGSHAGVQRIDHNLYNDCTDEVTVAEYGRGVYGIEIFQCPDHPEGYDRLRRDIANSFKFTNQLDTSTWKTYTNTEYGFSFKYPGDFNISLDGESGVYMENIHIQEPKDSFYFYMDFGVRNKKSVEIYNEICKNTEGECFKFEYSRCEQDNQEPCSEYLSGFRGESYLIKQSTFKKTNIDLSIDASINLELVYHGNDLNVDLNNFSDNKLETLANNTPTEYLSRDLSHIRLFNQILSTFKFTP